MAKKNLVLSADHVEKMQSGRKKSTSERNSALEALNTNSQFQNYRFWKNVDEAIIEGVVKAIDKARSESIKKKIAKLEQEIEGLRSQI